MNANVVLAVHTSILYHIFGTFSNRKAVFSMKFSSQ